MRDWRNDEGDWKEQEIEFFMDSWGAYLWKVTRQGFEIEIEIEKEK